MSGRLVRCPPDLLLLLDINKIRHKKFDLVQIFAPAHRLVFKIERLDILQWEKGSPRKERPYGESGVFHHL